MCGSAEGSIVSRNLVRESNQRCYVIHGTHNVTLDSNIAYDTFGHCFMLEDHAERDNILVDNLAAVTRKAVTVISSDETDDFCSSFWITNTENTFVGNVAAGSEHSGFWFEMESFVRGPSAMMPENNGYQPHKAPLTLFSENVAHSNDEHGVKTYPGTGYDPVEEQTFYKTKSYRNAGNGVFIHNSENIKIQGGLFADNRIQVDIDRSPTCTIDGALIVGYSPEFRNIRETTYSRGHCPSDWPIRGVEIHTYWTGGNKYTGTDISNTSFENFGNTGCADSSAIRVDEEDRGYFDIRTQVSGVVFDADSPPLSACDAIASGVDNFAMRDVDGSIMEVPGFIVADTPRMTTFGDCVSDPDSCTATCADQCFRAVVLAVSSLEDDSLALEVTDIASGTTLSFLGHYEYPLNADGSLNIAENTKTHRSRMFFAVLPSGGGYSATFVKNGAPYWPVYVHSDYDDPDSTCPELSSLEIVEPNDENCNELIKNGDMEAGIEGWSATMGGLLSVDESASGQGLALTNEYRTAYWMAPAQYLDTRCMVEGTHYSVSAKAKLVSKSTGAPVDCNAAAGMCPKLIVKVESGAHEKYDEYWHLIASPPATWVAEDWNTLSGYLIVHSHLASAGSILVYFESNTVNGGDAMLYVDDVSIVPASSSS